MTIALFALAGVLVGGVWSLRRQGAGLPVLAVMSVLALTALAAGLLRTFPVGD